MANAMKFRHAFGASCRGVGVWLQIRLQVVKRSAVRRRRGHALWTIARCQCHPRLCREERDRVLGGPWVRLEDSGQSARGKIVKVLQVSACVLQL